ncbi:hypothetical protein CP8484711_1199B, partial [Chlamydia psittaci 84-8471/1]
CSCCIK